MPSLTSTLVSLLLIGSATPSTAQTLHRNGKIAFTSDRDGNREIYTMNVDGTRHVRLTNNNIVDDHAMYSPDGRTLAFVSQTAAGGYAIFQMNIDGTNRTEITSLSQYLTGAPTFTVGFSMSWSPDSRKIAFQDPYYDDIWVVDVETHTRTNLTNDGGGQIGLFDHNPAWSPDGSTILYASPRYNGICAAIYAINPDGSNQRLVVPCQAYSPSWSPDGSQIVFVDLLDDFQSMLHISNSDGSNRRLFDGYPDNLGYRDFARWSPDGQRIAYSISADQDIEIYVKNVDGTGFTQLTHTPGRNYRPSWQPGTRHYPASRDNIDRLK